MTSEVTHKPDEHGVYRQIVTPQRLRAILDAAGDDYRKPAWMADIDEWTVDMTSRDWIKQATENDRDLLIDGIKRLYNCTEADVDADGDIWISGACAGHWLDNDDLARVAKSLEAGEI